MEIKTKLGSELALKLFKEFTVDYNPSSISKGLGKTRVGAFKAFRQLEKEGIVISKKLGKANFYKLRLYDEYVRKNIELLLMEESRKYPRWIEESRALSNFAEIIILFGSIIRNESKANDIDLLIVLEEKNDDKINSIIKSKNEILVKKIHLIKQTKEDMINNLKKQDKVVISAIKSGVVLFGFEKLVEMIKDVACR